MRRVCLLLAAFFPFWAGCSRPEEAVRVFAAASLQELTNEVSKEWMERGGPDTRLTYGSSADLARQILAGARADVFLSADPRWTAEVPSLKSADWVGNRLVLVTPRGASPVDVAHLESLALGGEGVPAGRYATAALASMGIDLPARVVYGSSVRDVLSKVADGAASAGIVYRTDARVEPRVEVVFEFPEKTHPPIRYVASALTPEGEAFLKALGEPWALERARDKGFLVP